MSVSYSKEQRQYAKEKNLKLVTIDITGVSCFQGTTSSETMITQALKILQSVLRKENPNHPALALFKE